MRSRRPARTSILRHLTTPMARGSAHGRGRRRHRALEQQLPRARRPARGRRGRASRGCDKYGAGHRVGALHLRNLRYSSHARGAHRASFLGTQAALTYVSCWNANTGLFATICGEGSAIVSDELNHASIIDGVRLATQSAARRYKHGDMADLEAKLRSVGDCSSDRHRHRRRLLDGGRSLPSCPRSSRWRRSYGAVTVVDDSHGTGVMGKTGRGTIEHFGLTGEDRHHHRHARQSAGRRRGRLRRRIATRSSTRSSNVRDRNCSQTRYRRRSRAARLRRSSISTRIPELVDKLRENIALLPRRAASGWATSRSRARARSCRSSSARRRSRSR